MTEAAVTAGIRCGDHVRHEPTGENWVVAYVDGDRLAPCGWPACEAMLADCTLIKACSDDEHRWQLEDLAEARMGRAGDKRHTMARALLASLEEPKT